MFNSAARGTLAVVCALAPVAGARADGWSVTKKPADGVCLAGRTGLDKAAGKKNSLVFGITRTPDGLNLTLTLTSEAWSFPKDQPLDADVLLFGVNDNTLSLRARWIGDGQTLTSAFDKGRALVNAFGNSPAFTLQTEPNRGVTFETPNAAAALASAEACLDVK